jgi:hypothetical protein
MACALSELNARNKISRAKLCKLGLRIVLTIMPRLSVNHWACYQV